MHLWQAPKQMNQVRLCMLMSFLNSVLKTSVTSTPGPEGYLRFLIQIYLNAMQNLDATSAVQKLGAKVTLNSTVNSRFRFRQLFVVGHF